jgi:hypothetical protein
MADDTAEIQRKNIVALLAKHKAKRALALGQLPAPAPLQVGGFEHTQPPAGGDRGDEPGSSLLPTPMSRRPTHGPGGGSGLSIQPAHGRGGGRGHEPGSSLLPTPMSIQPTHGPGGGSGLSILPTHGRGGGSRLSIQPTHGRGGGRVFSHHFAPAPTPAGVRDRHCRKSICELGIERLRPFNAIPTTADQQLYLPESYQVSW